MSKSKATALALSFLFGWVGADRWYVGDIGQGPKWKTLAILKTLPFILLVVLSGLLWVLGVDIARHTKSAENSTQRDKKIIANDAIVMGIDGMLISLISLIGSGIIFVDFWAVVFANDLNWYYKPS